MISAHNWKNFFRCILRRGTARSYILASSTLKIMPCYFPKCCTSSYLFCQWLSSLRLSTYWHLPSKRWYPTAVWIGTSLVWKEFQQRFKYLLHIHVFSSAKCALLVFLLSCLLIFLKTALRNKSHTIYPQCVQFSDY